MYKGRIVEEGGALRLGRGIGEVLGRAQHADSGYLVDNEEAFTVGFVELLLRIGVVARAEGVCAHPL